MRTGLVVTAQPGVEDPAVRAEELALSSYRADSTPMATGGPAVPRVA